MLVIAHRGANKEALENSWEAFEKSIEIGADRIELDVHLSSDGHPVIFHDHILNPLFFKEMEYPCDIGLLTRKQLLDFKLKNNESLPFLDEVLEKLLGRIELNIEIKGSSLELTQAVLELIERQSPTLKQKIIVSSFRFEPLVYLADKAPDIRCAALWYKSQMYWPYLSLKLPKQFMEKCQTSIFHPLARDLDERLMDLARESGWIVYPWTEMKGEDHDKEKLWEKLLNFGVHGLCTNYPRELKLWLSNNKS